MIQKHSNLLFNIFIIILFLSPTKIIYYVLGYILLIANVTNTYKNIRININAKLLLLFTLIIAFIYNINSNTDIKDYLIALNIIFLIILFPYFISNNISVKVSSIAIILFTVLVSQVILMFDISPIDKYISTLYENEANMNFDRYVVGTKRNGGIYFNPNQAAKYLTILFILTLIEIKKFKLKLILSSLIFISIILTGSRTGFLILIAALIYLLYRNKKYFFVFLTGIIGLLINLLYDEISSIRNFQFENIGSLKYKFDVLFNYINTLIINDSILDLLFGNFISDYNKLEVIHNLSLNYNFGFDAEFGMIISFMGIVFLLFLMIFYIIQFKLLLHSKYILLIVLFIMWPITSTVLFSFKTSILYMTILGYAINKCYQSIN